MNPDGCVKCALLGFFVGLTLAGCVLLLVVDDAITSKVSLSGKTFELDSSKQYETLQFSGSDVTYHRIDKRYLSNNVTVASGRYLTDGDIVKLYFAYADVQLMRYHKNETLVDESGKVWRKI